MFKLSCSAQRQQKEVLVASDNNNFDADKWRLLS